MLLLSRRTGEKILIGGREVTVTVLDVRCGRVRLGIDAPADISIARKEVHEGAGRDVQPASRAG